MSTYARITSGLVAELFTPPTGFTIDQCFHGSLQWIDCTNVDGISVGWTATQAGTDWTFDAPHPASGPSMIAQASALLSGGLHVTSTTTPALNGTYSVDDVSRADVVAIETSLNAGAGFPPGGAATFAYPDMAGFFHTFSPDDFTHLAAAMRDFVYACKSVIHGASSVLPAGEATIS